MNESIASSVLIISDDAELVDSLLANNKTGKQFRTRNSVQLTLEDPSVLDQNSLVILDLGGSENDVNKAINQVVKLKQQDPTQVLLITGESVLLGNLLKSNIQPIIYRAFTKPVSPNQLFLAFKSGDLLHEELVKKQAKGIDITGVGPAENRTNVASIAGQSRNKTPLFAGLGVLALIIIGWFLFRDDPAQQTTIDDQSIELPLDEAIEMDQTQPVVDETVTVSGRTQEINRLSQLAEIALIDQRIVSPVGDNALEYYEQVLALDPYNTSAYQGKKAIADRLRESYNQMITNTEFDKALNVITVLQRIEPLNIQNDALLDGLQKAVDLHVNQVRNNGSSEEVARASEIVDRLGANFTAKNSASNALKKEKRLLSKIDQALTSNIITPNEKGNAYTLVSNALKTNAVSKANITPRVSQLSQKLVALANTGFDQNSTEDTEKLIALIKRLNVDPNGLKVLNQKLSDRKAAELAALAEAEAQAPAEEEVVVEEPKIIPAKVISRAPPKYPTKAINRQAEGWVEVSFFIDVNGTPVDIKVVDSKPKNLFDNAALKAIKKWKFSPARNEETGLPVKSATISTRVQFKLDE